MTAAATTYVPGSAAGARALHCRVDLCPDHSSRNVRVEVRRIVALVGTIESGHCWLLQIESAPELTFTARSAEFSVIVHAGRPVVRTTSRIATGSPARLPLETTGVTETSAGRHGPFGTANAGVPALRPAPAPRLLADRLPVCAAPPVVGSRPGRPRMSAAALVAGG
jgi:hypothetical protein